MNANLVDHWDITDQGMVEQMVDTNLANLNEAPNRQVDSIVKD